VREIQLISQKMHSINRLLKMFGEIHLWIYFTLLYDVTLVYPNGLAIMQHQHGPLRTMSVVILNSL